MRTFRMSETVMKASTALPERFMHVTTPCTGNLKIYT